MPSKGISERLMLRTNLEHLTGQQPGGYDCGAMGRPQHWRAARPWQLPACAQASWTSSDLHCRSTRLCSSPQARVLLAYQDIPMGAGSSTGEVYLWRYGQATALAGYTPMAASGSAPSREAAPSLFTAPLRAWQLAPGVPSAQWGQPQAVRSYHISDAGVILSSLCALPYQHTCMLV